VWQAGPGWTISNLALVVLRGTMPLLTLYLMKLIVDEVVLARAFLRESQTIVLDEPTSAMDAKSEYEVFKRMRRLLEGRTAILISHRFSTVRMADRIFAFEKGRISESGTHDQLLQSGGKYAYLFEKQAQHYR